MMSEKMMTYLSFLAIILPCFVLVSCAVNESPKSQHVIGLYQVDNRICEVPEQYKNDCQSTKFIELVKGQFYGVKNNEIAFVNWQDDNTEELSYQARNITKKNKSFDPQSIIVISKTETDNEYLKVENGYVVEYVLSISKPTKDAEKITREYKYTLSPVIRSEIPDYRMNYPGNK